MHAIFSRRVVAVVGSSSQLTKLLKKQPSLSHRSHCRHLLPSGFSSSPATRYAPSLLSRSKKIYGSFSSTLRNNHLKLKLESFLESRVGFSDFQLPNKGFESGGFTGFQKRGWKSWFNGANGVVFGLITANVAVFTMWKVSDDKGWMNKNLVLSLHNFMTGLIHTLITSAFSHINLSGITFNMIGLYHFGTRIATTLGPLYLLKLYFAGALAGSVFFISVEFLIETIGRRGVVNKDRPKLSRVVGADVSVFAMTLLHIFLYPNVTTYFGLLMRVPTLFGILDFGEDLLKVVEGTKKEITVASIQVVAGAMIAAIAWARIRKGRSYY